jgi:hypothetical protein
MVTIRNVAQVFCVGIVVVLLALNALGQTDTPKHAAAERLRKGPDSDGANWQKQAAAMRRQRDELAAESEAAQATTARLRDELRFLHDKYKAEEAQLKAKAEEAQPKATLTEAPAADGAGMQWRAPSLQADSSSPPHAKFSSHQCNGQVFAGQEWTGRSCYHRNICYDTAASTFVYFADEKTEPETMLPPKDRREATEQYFYPKNKARGFLPQAMDVSLIAFNMQDGLDNANVPERGGGG